MVVDVVAPVWEAAMVERLNIGLGLARVGRGPSSAPSVSGRRRE
jgi:hypothetical protein